MRDFIRKKQMQLDVEMDGIQQTINKIELKKQYLAQQQVETSSNEQSDETFEQIKHSLDGISQILHKNDLENEIMPPLPPRIDTLQRVKQITHRRKSREIEEAKLEKQKNEKPKIQKSKKKKKPKTKSVKKKKKVEKV
jgi:hypothetical protein